VTFALLFLKLMMGHALADFALQSPDMAKGKNRNRKPDMAVVPPGQTYQPTWVYWLTAHALIHGLVVWLITGQWWLAVAETVAHWLIDFGKCDNYYGIHVDQGLHVACKVLWAIV
jgi:hypothetical protein